MLQFFFQFPRSFKVELSIMLKSEEFAQQLSQLHNTPMAGLKFDNGANLANPNHVSQRLMAVAGCRSPIVDGGFRRISKKARDEVILRKNYNEVAFRLGQHKKMQLRKFSL